MKEAMRVSALLLLLPSLVSLPGCGAAPKIADKAVAVVDLVEVPLPPGATALRAARQAGLDELQLLTFSAPEDAARRWAARVLGTPPQPGRDPGLLYLGEDVSWWPRTMPPGAEGGEVRRPDNRVVKLLLAPAPGRPTRVFVAAFSQ